MQKCGTMFRSVEYYDPYVSANLYVRKYILTEDVKISLARVGKIIVIHCHSKPVVPIVILFYA